jgi:hypothetical protein
MAIAGYPDGHRRPPLHGLRSAAGGPIVGAALVAARRSYDASNAISVSINVSTA